MYSIIPLCPLGYIILHILSIQSDWCLATDVITLAICHFHNIALTFIIIF